MSLTGIALIIIALAFLVLVLTLLPTVAAVRKTATSVGLLSDMLQTELKPAIQELTAVVAEMKVVGGGVAEHTEDVKKLMSALGETGSNLSSINRSVGMVAGALNTTTAYITGVKVAGKYLLERYLKKRGGI